jgi:hypothetical protein
MAIVYRNGRAYAYKSIRRNGRVTSEYRGSGDIAMLAALLDAEDQEQRDWERAERERLETAERTLCDYFNRVDDLARAALLASGFHQHKRQWRKRRERCQES